MGIPRTGSQGLSRDLWALCHAACYEVPSSDENEVHRGHAQTPPPSVADRFEWIDVEWVPGQTVPFDPKCKRCRQVGKRVMERRGLTREQVKNCFDALGARWEWTSRETDEKRRNSDRGEMVVDQNGNLSLDVKVQAKKRAAARKIQRQDDKADRRARALKGA